MPYSITTTHVGSLPRPAELLSDLLERERGGPELDPDTLTAAVAACVAQQRDTGLDIVNDGELGRISYVTYVRNRLTGFTPGEGGVALRVNALDDFPEFTARRAGLSTFRDLAVPVCTGPIGYPDTAAVESDIARLQAGLNGHAEAFMTAASPGVVAMFLRNEFHPDRESYVAAIGEAMKTEYDAIHRAGLLLQLDCPDLAVSRSVFPPDDEGLQAFRRLAAQNVEVLNHALRDIPADRIRMHSCWGNYEGPHNRDVPLRDVIDILLTARPRTLSFEGANPRHGHEWALFDEVELPADKVIMPGMIDSTTNYVEHPELVAQRIERYARIVGPERVIASTDCGLATFATSTGGVDGRVAWAKLRSLTEGAEIASRRI